MLWCVFKSTGGGWSCGWGVVWERDFGARELWVEGKVEDG